MYFRIDKGSIDTTFLDNAAVIRKMTEDITALIGAKGITLDSVSVVSAASPDGGNLYNVRLSGRRAESAARMVMAMWPDIASDRITTEAVGEDWTSLKNIVEEDGEIPHRDELMRLINSSAGNDAKEKVLRSMKETFRYLVHNHLSSLRASSLTFKISMPAVSLDTVELRVLPYAVAAPGSVVTPSSASVLPDESPVLHTEKKMIMAARTNLLVPALNVGLEIPIGTDWSVGVDYYYPWWLAKSNKYCVEMLGLFIDGKYWFGQDRTETDKLTGHALGVYAGAGYYDFQWLKSGYQGEYVDVGVDYTYSIPLAKDKLRMEFNIGLGWIHTVARHYTPTDDYGDLIKDPGIRHMKYNFFGPTRASVSLVVPIRVRTSGKGGGR